MKTGIDYVFDFGKHKGRTVGELLDIDPSYLLWAEDNVDKIDLEEDVYEDAMNRVEAEREYDEDWENWWDVLH